MDDILITGSSGFIGSNLCHSLDDEFNVTGVDLHQPVFDLPDEVDIHTLDITKSPNLPEVDVIVHLAAHSQVQPIVENPELAIENIEMTQHVLSEASRMGAFVVNASSRDIYGDNLQPEESEVTLNSPNGYAASKIGSEAIVNAYQNVEDVSAVSLRLSNVYGRRDLNRRLIPIFIARANAGQQLVVYGKEKVLDLIHISDVCSAIHNVIDRREVLAGEAINIGSGVARPLPEIAAQISEHIESCPGWKVGSDRSGDVSEYVADISKSTALLNMKPSVCLNEGLTRTINWYLDNTDKLDSIRFEETE